MEAMDTTMGRENMVSYMLCRGWGRLHSQASPMVITTVTGTLMTMSFTVFSRAMANSRREKR